MRLLDARVIVAEGLKRELDVVLGSYMQPFDPVARDRPVLRGARDLHHRPTIPRHLAIDSGDLDPDLALGRKEWGKREPSHREAC